MHYLDFKKQAADPSWKKWLNSIGFTGSSPEDEQRMSQAFRASNIHPYATEEAFENAGFNSDNIDTTAASMGHIRRDYRNEGTLRDGHIPYSYKPINNSSTNHSGWSYTIYKPTPESNGVYGAKDSVSFNVYPEKLPNYRYGKQLQEATSGYTKQPFNMQQLMSMQAGDSGYLDKLLAHYRSVNPAYWRDANLQLSSPAEIEKWKEAVPSIAPKVVNDPRGNASRYNADSGSITTTPYSQRIDDYANHVNSSSDDPSQSPLLAKPSNNADSLFRMRHTPNAAAADSFFHELNHYNSIGKLRMSSEPYPHMENIPSGRGGNATLMRQATPKGLYLTPVQNKWIEDHNIESYAVNENEMNQALLSFNAGRYRLQKDMQDNPDNPNYAQIDPSVRQQFASFPQFIQPGEAGKQQLDELMTFYDQNPEFITMMPEQARLVGYYKNLKAAVENSEDPVEKEFFQGMMNRMIYNKSFLADSQRSNTNQSKIASYTEFKKRAALGTIVAPGLVTAGGLYLGLNSVSALKKKRLLRAMLATAGGLGVSGSIYGLQKLVTPDMAGIKDRIHSKYEDWKRNELKRYLMSNELGQPYRSECFGTKSR